jgi:D-alanyl-D-alanine dipeptidase
MKPHINPAEWVNLKLLHPQIKLDIAYARADNFIGEKVYPLAEAFLMKF